MKRSVFQQSAAATEIARRAVEQAQNRKNGRRAGETKLARERLYRLNQQMAQQYTAGEPVHPDQWDQLLDLVETIDG